MREDLESQVAELRRTVADLRRLIESMPVRDARQLPAGTYLYGTTTTDLILQAGKTCEVAIEGLNPDGSIFTASTIKGVQSRRRVTGKKIPSGTGVRLELDPLTGVMLASIVEGCFVSTGGS